MNPINFPEANSTLKGGDKWPDPVDDLKVFRDDTQLISKWRLTLRERLSALVFGNVWLYVLGKTSYPVGLQAARSVFAKKQ